MGDARPDYLSTDERRFSAFAAPDDRMCARANQALPAEWRRLGSVAIETGRCARGLRHVTNDYVMTSRQVGRVSIVGDMRGRDV